MATGSWVKKKKKMNARDTVKINEPAGRLKKGKWLEWILISFKLMIINLNISWLNISYNLSLDLMLRRTCCDVK